MELTAATPKGSKYGIRKSDFVPVRFAFVPSLWERLMTTKDVIVNMDLRTRLILVGVSYEAAPRLARLATIVLRSIMLKLSIAWSKYRKRGLPALCALMSVLQRRMALISSA